MKCNSKVIQICGIYYPGYSPIHPYTKSFFLAEFTNFLEETVMCSEILIIAGDMNFHMDDITDHYTIKMNMLLDSYNLFNNVCFPTHENGHALDMLINRKHCEINLQHSYS